MRSLRGLEIFWLELTAVVTITSDAPVPANVLAFHASASGSPRYARMFFLGLTATIPLIRKLRRAVTTTSGHDTAGL